MRSLSEEIRRVIDDGLDQNRPQPASWIVKAVLERHPFPADWRGGDREFAENCCTAYIRAEVRKRLRDYKAAEAEDAPAQNLLPGFAYLQRAYLVDRDDEPCVVPLAQLTAAEIEAAAVRLDGMAQGCTAHAAELRRYAANASKSKRPAAEAA